MEFSAVCYGLHVLVAQVLKEGNEDHDEGVRHRVVAAVINRPATVSAEKNAEQRAVYRKYNQEGANIFEEQGSTVCLL